MTILYERLEPQTRRLVPLLGPDVSVVTGLDDLVERVNADAAETLVLFGPGAPLAEAAEFATEARTRRPALGVLLLRESPDPQGSTQALAAGVREVVDADDPAAVLAACGRFRETTQLAAIGPAPVRVVATARVPAPAEPAVPQPAEVIAVYSPKGGCGKSTVATNLAVALAGTGSRVCLIDLDLAFGDIAIMLQLSPEHTLTGAVPVAGQLDETGLHTLLTPYRPGIDVLLAPVAPAEAEQISRELVQQVIRLARADYDVVVLDLPSQLTEPTLSALDAAHRYVLVTTPELPALKSLRVVLDTFDLLDYRREDRLVVLNRSDAKSGLSTVEVDRVVRVPIAARIPSSKDVPISMNRGEPLVVAKPGHPVSVAVRGLVTSHLGYGDPAEPHGLRRLFSRRRAVPTTTGPAPSEEVAT